MKLCTIHEINNKIVDEFFALLWHHLLPKPNCLATNYYVARGLTQKLGLVHENIHACAKGCILFRGDHKDDVNCPKYGSAKYKDDVNNVLPMKVFHHFPIIPRLEQLFKTPTMFELMLWHPQNSSSDGLVKHPCNSKAWKHIQQKFPDFVVDPRNVHLGFVVDGVNPFKLTWSKWSMWPVMLLHYNLPPWLMFKFFFILFTLLILDRKRICHI
jgi:hypothetical protein